MHLNMVSGRLSRFTPIPATPEMDATSVEDPEWSLAFLRSFPSTIRDKAAAYHAVWKKNGFGTKESLAGLREGDLERMKFLLSDNRAIMAQLALIFEPVALPVFVPPVVPVIGSIRSAWNTKNMNAMESKDPSSSTGTMPELNDFVSMLIVYCD